MEGLFTIDISLLRKHPLYPRIKERKDVINSIAYQIKENNNVFDPAHALIVRPIGNNKYQIISGNYRYQAALKCGLKELPCWVKDYDDEKAHMKLILCNMQAEYLPLEIGVHAFHHTQHGWMTDDDTECDIEYEEKGVRLSDQIKEEMGPPLEDLE